VTNTLAFVDWLGSKDWKEDEQWRVADALEELVGAVAVSVGRSGAVDLLENLLHESLPALPPDYRARVIQRSAESAAALERDRIEAVLDCVAAAAQRITDDRARGDALLGVLIAYSEAGAVKAAQKTATAVMALLDGVPNDDDRSQGMALVGSALQRLHLTDEADQAFAPALDAARRSGREAVYYVIDRYVEGVVDPERLIDISRTIIDVDSWWRYRPPGSADAFIAAVSEGLAKHA
jgi:hypothetical protein